MMVLTAGCQPQPFDQERCEQLSMKSFKGIPHSAQLFKNHCQHLTIVYHQQHCQKALESLILQHSLKEIKEKFGEKIEHCFTSNDLKKFGQNPSHEASNVPNRGALSGQIELLK
jgi:hypothetical protein